MTPEDFAELDRLFNEAVQLGPDERKALVSRVRETSPGVADHLAALLKADAAFRPSRD